MNHQDNQDNDKLSFNMAVDYTSKIAQYMDEFETLWQKGFLKEANWGLKKVWHKLSPFLSEGDDEYIEKEFNDIQKMIISKDSRSKVNFKIEKLARHISRELNGIGLLIPVSKDPRFLFRKNK